MEFWEAAARESVRQLLADYTAATDGFDLAALAACFGPEGRLEFSGGGPFVGPAEIEAGLASQLARDRSGPAPTHVRHHVSSVRFDSITRETASVSSYFVVFTDVGVDHWGRYRDVVGKRDGRWLFSSRRIRVDGFASASLMNVSAGD